MKIVSVFFFNIKISTSNKEDELVEKKEGITMKKKCFLLMAIMISCLVLMKGFALADLNDVAVSPRATVSELAPLTEEEMAAAQPLIIERAIEEGQEPISCPVVEQPVGETVVFPSSPGEMGAKYSTTPFEVNDTEIEPQTYPSDAAYSYPFPFTRLEVFNVKRGAYRKFPYRTIGQLFFYIPGLGSARCTASVAQEKWVWTAGHCVVSPPENWHTNFTFRPGARKTKKPFGTWKWDNDTVSLVGWSSDGYLCYDIGAVRFKKKKFGTKRKTLAQRVGHLGFMYGASREQHWNEFGYPAASPFDGTKLIQSQSSIGEDDTLTDPSADCGDPGAPLPIGVGNDMTGGSSGGPWIVDFSGEAGSTNYINSVNSFKYTSPYRPGAVYGPYFGTGAMNIWNYMTANP
ncbi:MAG: trypsin-like serine protease [Proteobacteria bacterium]|nr:trypsin-like serine protease [Pseudomonadota bacterium]